MGKPKGFIEIPRREPGYRPVEERIRDFDEVELRLNEEELRKQAARCMDCGVPFCHGAGCPLHNVIPEWNEMVYQGHWKEALELLLSNNNFPEFTGRVCPALCETACTVGVVGDPVAIRQIEIALVERGFEEGYIKPHPPEVRSGKRIAVVGSGPSGLAMADQLNKMGYLVTVYERDLYPGGLLRYGIPDFKLDKKIVQRRIELMKEEGVIFETGVKIGGDISSEYLLKRADAVCLACGARAARDLKAPGRELKGIHFALDYLWQQNCLRSQQPFQTEALNAKGKKVLVIGGGDTGSDCVGTARRQGALSITQIEIMPKPPESRHPGTPWPQWPYQLRSSSSHKEGCERLWNIQTKSFEGENAVLKRVNLLKVQWDEDASGRPFNMREIPGSEFAIEADLVLLAMGFTGPEKEGPVSQFGLELDSRGNVKVDSNFMSSRPAVFAAGDIVSGASLVVRAMAAGCELAVKVDQFLRGSMK
ncbi:MAG: glutamate synthase [Lentisphaerae bacterium GWF2_52_8]|nr:MAG: glutamate synthase [Lentisphaerae bacterium GWF2_52_8]